MKFDAARLSVLSGLKNNDSTEALNESTKGKSINENKLRQMIREEIQAYMSAKMTRDENQLHKGLQDLNLVTAMGYLNATPPYTNSRPNRSYSRGPGRTFGFGGPGFM